MFAEKFRLKRNWLKGYCTVRTFEGHTQGTCACVCLLTSFVKHSFLPGISCIQFDDLRIVSGSWDKTIKVQYYSSGHTKIPFCIVPSRKYVLT